MRKCALILPAGRRADTCVCGRLTAVTYMHAIAQTHVSARLTEVTYMHAIIHTHVSARLAVVRWGATQKNAKTLRNTCVSVRLICFVQTQVYLRLTKFAARTCNMTCVALSLPGPGLYTWTFSEFFLKSIKLYQKARKNNKTKNNKKIISKKFFAEWIKKFLKKKFKKKFTTMLHMSVVQHVFALN